MLTPNSGSPRTRAVAALVATVTGALITAPAALAVAPTFDSPVTYTGATNAEDVTFADVTGDGRGDLVTATYDSTGGLKLFAGQDGGGFGTTPGDLTTGAYTKKVINADLNGDGRADLITLDDASITIREGISAGLGLPTSHAMTDGKPYDITAADLNGDGKLDLAAAGYAAGSPVSGRMFILLNDGSGGFGTTETILTGSNRGSASITAADFDGDGDKDLAVANGGRQDISVYRNNGTGVFGDVDGFPTAQTNIAFGTTASAIASGDFTGDGKTDLVASAGGSIKVLRGDGAGGFTPGDTWFASGQQNFTLEVADVNGDGKLDVVTQMKDPGTVEILTGKGDGTFDTAQTIAIGGYLDAVHVADFDGDTKPDIAGAVYFGSKLVVLKNTTPIPVAPQVTLTTPPLTKATYTQGQAVQAAYACTDDTTAGLTCTGPVANGANIDTSTIGTNIRFEVVAHDADGLETRVAHFYDVVAAPAKVEEPAPTTTTTTATPKATTPAPTKQQIVQEAVKKQSAPVTSTVKKAPAKQPAKPLLSNKPVFLPIKTTVPNVLVIGGYVVSAGGANVVSAGGGNVISAGGGNVVSAGGGNVVSAGGGNVVSAGGGNLFGGIRGFAAAAKKPKLVVLAKGQKTFAKPGTGKLGVKLTKQGKALLKKAFAKKGKQSVKVTYAVGFQEPGYPAVVATRTITIKE